MGQQNTLANSSLSKSNCIYIENDTPIGLFGAVAKSYLVTGNFYTDYFQAEDSVSLTILKDKVPAHTITLEVDFHGADREEVTLNKSKMDSFLLGGVTLKFPDQFKYQCALMVPGEVSWQSDYLGSAAYQFAGIRIKDLIEIKNTRGPIECISTVPFTEVRLDVVSTVDAEVYTFAGVQFYNVVVGDHLTLDGITKRILINDAPGALRSNILEFPMLVPGENNLVHPSDPDPIDVAYYPTFL